MVAGPIGYMWGREQPELLNSMIESGINAVLVKVASFGLGKKHLGKSLKENQEEFMKMVKIILFYILN